MPSTGFPVAVVFLVFKRPALTRRVFERIRAVRPSRLYVVADGPRPGNPVEAERCREVRALIEDGIDWPCDLIRDYADANLGCARRVSSGIARAFEDVETAVILEDDCLPDPTFFPFCADLLQRYREDERIAQIAGCSFRPVPPSSGESYAFSRYPHCWGWATWRRAWQDYDHGMAAWFDPVRRQQVLDALDPAEVEYWRHAFAGTASGRIDSWAYRWTLTCWAHRRLSIVAAHNLVSNIGYEAGATHTDAASPIAALPTTPMTFPLLHPSAVARDASADTATSERCFRRPGILQRLRRRVAALAR